MAKARNWREVRADAVASGRISDETVADARKQHDARVRAYRLRQLREAQNTNQTELARAMNVTQSRVSKIEHGELSHTELGTLQSYVHALGGELRVVADFGDEQLTVA